MAFTDGSTPATDDVEWKEDTNDNGNFAAPSGDFLATPNKKWHFINYSQKDKSHGVNGYDGLRTYDPSAGIAEITLTGGAFPATKSATSGDGIGPYLALWKQRLWATKADELNYAVYASDLNSNSVWQASTRLDFDDDQGGIITGIRPWNDVLLIFKDTGIFRFIGDIEFLDTAQTTLLSDYGCVAAESITTTPYGIMYLARDGLRLTDGQDTQGVELSEPIRADFVGAASQTIYSDCLGDYTPRKHQYWMKLSSTSGIRTMQRVNLSEGEYWAWADVTGKTAVSEITVGQAESDNGRIFLGDTAGKYWEADTGLVDNDDGVETSFDPTIKFAFSPISQNKMYGRVVRARLVYRGKSTCNLRLYGDDSDGAATSRTMGTDFVDARLQSVDLAIASPGTHYQWVSAQIRLPDESYRAELHSLELDIKTRGRRVRNVNI